MKYRAEKKQVSRFKHWPVIALVAVLLVAGGVAGLRIWYDHNLRPISSSRVVTYFTIEPGTGVHQIAVNLQGDGLIRSAGAFETYVRSNELHDKLQAGTYALSPSMSVQQIAAKMASGDVAKNLLTILPGKRLDQIKDAFKRAGYSQADIDVAFDPAMYAGNPALSSLPKGASLEGYLYPDSFQKESATPAGTIVEESLAEMSKYLTPDIISGFQTQGLTTYQGITLASIVLQETGSTEDQPIVAQIFLSRLRQEMALGSDVTAMYGAIRDGVDLPDNTARAAVIAIQHNSPYNTRIYKGLPPGPISNVTASALKAVAHPASTNYLYFVVGDNGDMHYSYTQQQHDQAVRQYCTKSCSP